jgi:hypothetical protein
MNRFDLTKSLADIYSSKSFSVDGRQPVIGITGNYGEQTCKLGEGYYKQIYELQSGINCAAESGVSADG